MGTQRNGARRAGYGISTWVVAAFAATLLPATQVLAANSIATAVDVNPQAESLLGSDVKVIVAKDDLYEGQRITTGQYGQVHILFADQTKMVVGPSSSLLIEKILMRNNGTASSFAVKALGGTYRFLTGNSEKTAYQIGTPTGTIGVRGTEFDFVVDKETGETKVILFSGAAILCSESDACVTLTEICGMASSTSTEAMLSDEELNRRGLNQSGFKYVGNQGNLLKAFQVDDASKCGQAIQAAFPTFQSLSEPGDPTPPPDDVGCEGYCCEGEGEYYYYGG